MTQVCFNITFLNLVSNVSMVDQFTSLHVHFQTQRYYQQDRITGAVPYRAVPKMGRLNSRIGGSVPTPLRGGWRVSCKLHAINYEYLYII